MPDLAASAGRRLSPLRPRVERWSRKRSRKAFIRRVRFGAAWVGATVDLEVGFDVTISRSAKVTFRPGSANVLRVGQGTSIADDVLIMLKGGEVLLGPRTDLRHNVVLNVAGRLELAGDNPVSWGSVIHCSNSVVIHETAGVAERVTIADSSHYFTTPGENFYHNTKVGSIVVGANTWLCPNATLTRLANVGDHCIVAAGSVVIGEIPPGHLASGVPAVATAMKLPWQVEPVAKRAPRKRAGTAR